MNHYTQVDDILYGYVPRQPIEPNKSKVKVIFCKWTEVH